jgi:hypothetical protein
MARPRKILPVVLGLGAIFIGILIVFVTGGQRSDEELIRLALAESIEASREGRPGGVMDHLSDQFMINEQSPGTRVQIAKFIRDSKPEVEVLDPNPVVHGDTAEIVSPVRIQVNYFAFSADETIPDVRLQFEREEGRRFVFFPARKWRLVHVQVPEGQVPMQMF